MAEMFKPKQFDSFKKVPEDQKSKFKKEKDGSFVYKEALTEKDAINEAIHMQNLKNNPYIRTGNDKYKNDRSWTEPKESLEKMDSEHYERASELIDHWKEQNEETHKEQEEYGALYNSIRKEIDEDREKNFETKIEKVKVTKEIILKGRNLIKNRWGNPKTYDDELASNIDSQLEMIDDGRSCGSSYGQLFRESSIGTMNFLSILEAGEISEQMKPILREFKTLVEKSIGAEIEIERFDYNSLKDNAEAICWHGANIMLQKMDSTIRRNMMRMLTNNESFLKMQLTLASRFAYQHMMKDGQDDGYWDREDQYMREDIQNTTEEYKELLRKEISFLFEKYLDGLLLENVE